MINRLKIFEQLIDGMTADDMRYFEGLLRSIRIKKEEAEGKAEEEKK